MMKIRAITYRWMIAALLMLGWLPVSAQTEAFRTTSSRDQWAMTNMSYQTATAPAYQFRTTSPYTALVNSTSTVGAPAYAPSGPRRGPWDPPEDNPIGVLPDPAPLGEPLILLLLATLFILYKKKRVTSK